MFFLLEEIWGHSVLHPEEKSNCEAINKKQDIVDNASAVQNYVLSFTVALYIL